MKVDFDFENVEKSKVKINHKDLWSLDYTLAHVILPSLKKFKKHNIGYSYVKPSDVPKKLRFKDVSQAEDIEIYSFGFVNISDSLKKRNRNPSLKTTNDIFVARYDYVLKEMIFAFKMVIKDDSSLLDDKVEDRINNGLYLFGKYYRTLWV